VHEVKAGQARQHQEEQKPPCRKVQKRAVSQPDQLQTLQDVQMQLEGCIQLLACNLPLVLRTVVQLQAGVAQVLQAHGPPCHLCFSVETPPQTHSPLLLLQAQSHYPNVPQQP